LTPNLRLAARRIYYLPIDLINSITGRRPKIVPPKGLIFTGPGNFTKIGDRFLKHFIQFGNLNPHHNVLDVGSGIGRMAIPLTTYLTTGKYEGFDIVEKGIKWCTKNITKRFPNFQFKHISLKNDLYSSDGSDAVSFMFPYPDNSFDFVFLTSVFTHMLPVETEHYMSEISRVMKKGGRCFATFFILNDESIRFMNDSSFVMFPFNHGHYSLMDEKVVSANVACQEDYIRQILAGKNKFSITIVRYGSWSGRPKVDSTDYQDIVVFEKN
jgi:ubiquinone/menaquinone biosynthesis C-methylase UbiE